MQSQFSHYFIAGMALCLVYREGWSWTLAPILALAYGNAVHRGIGFASDVGNRYHATINRAVVVCVITVILVVLLLVALRVTSGLARPWMAVASALTYPLYLVHAHVGFVLFGALGGRVDRWVLLAGLVIAMCLLAYAIHALVERPFAPVLRLWLRQAVSGRRRRTASSQRMPIPPAKNSGHE